jgi:hypothetical protein
MTLVVPQITKKKLGFSPALFLAPQTEAPGQPNPLLKTPLERISNQAYMRPRRFRRKRTLASPLLKPWLFPKVSKRARERRTALLLSHEPCLKAVRSASAADQSRITILRPVARFHAAITQHRIENASMTLLTPPRSDKASRTSCTRRQITRNSTRLTILPVHQEDPLRKPVFRLALTYSRLEMVYALFRRGCLTRFGNESI